MMRPEDEGHFEMVPFSWDVRLFSGVLFLLTFVGNGYDRSAHCIGSFTKVTSHDCVFSLQQFLQV